MAHSINRSRWMVLIAVAVVAIIALFINGNQVGTAKAVVISEEEAVRRAIHYARMSAPAGRLDGIPTRIYGTVLGFNDAARHTAQGFISFPGEQDPDRPTWMFVLEGKVLVEIPGSPGGPDGNIPPQVLVYPQMSIVLDGKTGEFLSSGMYPSGETLDTSALQEFTIPASLDEPLPTMPPAPTTAPLPTMPPAPARNPSDQ